jgi:hypothetical protein
MVDVDRSALHHNTKESRMKAKKPSNPFHDALKRASRTLDEVAREYLKTSSPLEGDTPPTPHPPQTDDTLRDWPTSSLRQATHDCHPASITDARHLSMECISRAQALARILAIAAWYGDAVSVSDLRVCVELIDDMCYLSYGLMAD